MHDDTLICTSCDEIVRTTHGYDGYIARCSCSYFALQAGSGERPVMWDRLEDLTSPRKFKTEQDWSDGTGDITHVTCTACGAHDATTVEIEETSLPPFDFKAVFTCSNEHYQRNITLSETAYYNGSDGEKLLEYCADDASAEPG